MNRRPLISVVVATALLVLAVAAITRGAASPQAGQCPDYQNNTKVDTSDGSIVLPAGLTVCIHASDGNTGLFQTDGTSTLADYILASGLLNNGGQVPNVSNYVIYEEGTPSDSPTMTPSVDPTPTQSPSDSPSDSPTATPSAVPTSTESPVPTPTISATPSVGPTATPRASGTGTTTTQMPNTSTI